ncbi:hypothetical protein [Candidatus Parabeggiatoa sp. HSG14]|uniref:hypothetical protein n=1 Tax=Candidatus Parabeggiatoa sp. HSG14 TaxID=3055593 RepID=UPI0025A72947|nr:hypothetical protein [Thiotrichales bacterium HSG14]
MTLNFKDCTLEQLDESFNLEQIDDCQILQTWLYEKLDISDLERQIIVIIQKNLKNHVHDWNEMELIQHFIGPIFSLINFSSKKFGLFAERAFSGTVDGIELSGRPDGIIASGFRKPKKPYFCFQEYKKEKEPDGDPAAQALAAMLVAQEINEHKHPIYGCYVRGQFWFFMALQDVKYCISQPYTATRDDIFDIFRILKVLKNKVADLVEHKQV